MFNYHVEFQLNLLSRLAVHKGQIDRQTYIRFYIDGDIDVQYKKFFK